MAKRQVGKLFCISEGLGLSSQGNVSFFLACAGTRVSHKSSWCYQQLSEGNVSLWVVTAALHNPDGNWSSCWYPDRSKREQIDVGMWATKWVKAGVNRDNRLLQRQTEMIVFAQGARGVSFPCGQHKCKVVFYLIFCNAKVFGFACFFCWISAYPRVAELIYVLPFFGGGFFNCCFSSSERV